MKRISVLYEDNHLLVVDKPSGIATMGAAADQPSMHADCCEYLRKKYQKPGRVYLGIVSRLDKWTSGVLPLARTSKAAARLNAQMQEGTIQKTYLALVAGSPPERGTYQDWLFKDDAAHRMRVGREGQGVRACLRWQTLATHDEVALLRVELETGRKHQIRVQFAERGFPILGDVKYGGPKTSDIFGLHCYRVGLTHPTRKEPLTFSAPAPGKWSSLGLPTEVLSAAHR